MTPSATPLESNKQLDDVLAYLPISITTDYKKGESIYSPKHPLNSIYMVVSGIVGVSQIAEGGREVLLDIIRPDELFGEVAFIDLPSHSELATALEKTRLMTWAISDIENLVMTRPRLALGLVQGLVLRNIEFARRIESFSTESIERRLARTLIRFSERLGTADKDGSLRLMPFTHEVLSRYVGTSREIITHHMNRFRKQGCVSYSRRGIVLHRDAVHRFELAGQSHPAPCAAEN
jgi:CRP/FNR family cyclic AMP-dependent transcriptional regulator